MNPQKTKRTNMKRTTNKQKRFTRQKSRDKSRTFFRGLIPRGKDLSYSGKVRDKFRTQRQPSQADKLKIFALGGLEEVGRNMTVFEYGSDIIIVDMGLQFPEEDMHGIDYIIPNISYLKGKERNIRGVILTHGHLDHIGAIPHLLPKLGNPLIIGAPMTLALVKKQIENHHQKFVPQTLEVRSLKKPTRLGKFRVNFFQVEHSVVDSLGVVIETSVVNVIHPGDWRFDLDPVEGKKSDYTHLTHWNTKNKPSVLMMESLGATEPGHQGSEREVYNKIKEIIEKSPGRVIIATFSSMLERAGQVISIAEKSGKKVAVDGYSMKANLEIGKQFGFIKAKSTTLIDVSKIHDYPENKIVVLCTGSQGEGRAVLQRIANKEHRHIKIEPNDTIIFSSSVIPGNERSIQTLKDSLYRQGANVIHKEIMDVHAGGHGKMEDIKLLLQQTKPAYLIPIYANRYLLHEAGKVASSIGFDPKKIFIADNGQVIEFDKNGGRLTEQRVPTEYVFVDGLGVGDVSNIVLRDRQMMAADGMIVVIVTIDKKKGKLVQNPDLISRGFVDMKENKKLIEETRTRTKKMFKGNIKGGIDENYYKDKIRNEIGKFLYQKTQRRPMVLPVIIQF